MINPLAKTVMANIVAKLSGFTALADEKEATNISEKEREMLRNIIHGNISKGGSDVQTGTAGREDDDGQENRPGKTLQTITLEEATQKFTGGPK